MSKKNKAININIDALEVISPCSVDWNDMQGDDKIRFCGYCEKNVFNLVSMTRAEIAEALAGEVSRGNLKEVCVQIVKRRTDGKLVTADCVRSKERFALKPSAHRFVRFAAVLLAGFVGVNVGAAAQESFDETSSPAANSASQSNGATGCGSTPKLQGSANGTIGPQGGDATVIHGVNTAGTVRVSGGSNFEALYGLALTTGKTGLCATALFFLWKMRKSLFGIPADSDHRFRWRRVGIAAGALASVFCLVGVLWITGNIPLPLVQLMMSADEITLDRDRVIDGLKFPAGSAVSFGVLGTLKRATLHSRTTLHNIAFPSETSLDFYELERGSLGAAYTQNEVSFGKTRVSGKRIHIGFDGYTSKVREVSASDLVVNGRSFGERSVSFLADGTVRENP